MADENKGSAPACSFRDAMMDTDTYTENGALSLSTTQPVGMAERIHGRTAFFFKTVRSLLTNEAQLYKYLELADAENVRDTLVLVFHLRNCRSKNGGKGERGLFRLCVEWYKSHGKGELLEKNLSSVVEFGRWDDVLICPGGYALMAKQLLADYEVVSRWQDDQKVRGTVDAPRPVITLASKWAPSACMKNKKSKGKHAPMVTALNDILANSNQRVMGRRVLREREYRKILSLLREHSVVLERLMCQNQWDLVDFNHVPSNAMHLYGKSKITMQGGKSRKRRHDPSEDRPGAFVRHCSDRFTQWREALKTGKMENEDGTVVKVKVNAAQLFPHEVVSRYLVGRAKSSDALVESQWSVLESEVKKKGNLSGCLFVADVSGSMEQEASPGSSTRCMDVAVALSLLGARCSTGQFQNLVMTFSEDPCFFDVATGSYCPERPASTSLGWSFNPVRSQDVEIEGDSASMFAAVTRLSRMDWGGSTNLQAVFDLILTRSQKFKVPESECPKVIVVISDMEFNSCAEKSLTNFEAIQTKYKTAGYKMPTLVFWNVRSSSDTHQFPVSADENGTILLSGYSPSILKELMDEGFTNVTPWKVVRRVIEDPIYANITV